VVLLLKSVAVWLLFILVESLNGTIRTFWLVPSVGDPLAHYLSFITGMLTVLAIALLFIRWLGARRVPQLLGIGGVWMGLTLAFEVFLGRVILHYSWGQVMADYDVHQGGLMTFGLLWVALAPLMAAKIRGLLPNHHQLA
jgi:hypothetical protein